MSKMTFFFGMDNPLSNWHPSIFTVNKVQFNCMEQFMMYCKAKLFGDEDTAAKILAASHPRIHKALGRDVKPFDQAKWEEKREVFVTKGAFAKFSQNPELKAVLLATAGTQLVEASKYDKIWGCGLEESDPRIHDAANWTGMNLLGKDLMIVRDQLGSADDI